MPPGRIVRRLLGPGFRPIGEAYRRIFVDMSKVAAWIDHQLPHSAHVLDIGGGDGYVVNLLLDRRPDLRVTMTDIAADIGSFISPENRPRVELRPATDIANIEGRYSAITLADVVHHVPIEQRSEFLTKLGAAAHRIRAAKILIKDIKPGSPRAVLSLLSDHYITGDRHVVLANEDEIAIPGFRRTSSAMPDHPNYCLAFSPA